MAKIKITLTKSPIGYNKKQRATAEALGLRKLQASVVQEDTPDIMGKVQTIAHLLAWEPLEAQPKAVQPKAAAAETAETTEAPKRAPRKPAKPAEETAAELSPVLAEAASKQAPRKTAKPETENTAASAADMVADALKQGADQ